MDANNEKVVLNGTPPLPNREQTNNESRESKFNTSMNSNDFHNNNSFNESNDYSTNPNLKSDSLNYTERKNKGFNQQVSFKDEVNSVSPQRLTPIKKKPEPKNIDKSNENQPKKSIDAKMNEDYFLSLFEPNSDLLIDDYDLSLYSKYIPNKAQLQTRYLDLNDDETILKRIKERIENREKELKNQRKSIFDVNNPDKEINVKIDITTDGAKIRHMSKSRNGQIINENPLTNRSNKNTKRIPNEFRDSFALKKFDDQKTQNSRHISLPALVRSNPKKDGEDDGSETPLFYYADSNENDVNRDNLPIHEYLYSLSKKGNEGNFFRSLEIDFINSI